jgi:hypothetical protein
LLRFIGGWPFPGIMEHENPFENLHTLFDYSQEDKDWMAVRDFIEDVYDNGDGAPWDVIVKVMAAAQRLAVKAGSGVAV